jgi:hypothetical protein
MTPYDPEPPDPVHRPKPAPASGSTAATPPPPPASQPPKPELLPLLEAFLDKLKYGIVELPTGDGSGGASATAAREPGKSKPTLVLVEVYGISWFPGTYGLGRTVKTFTLFPGEQTTIRTRTWRSSETSIKESSSIFDSQSTEASDRFRTAVQSETTDKQTQASKTEWHVEASVEASWGWGKAEVSGGASGEYHAGREQFSKQVNDTAQEHASMASNKRDTTVTSSTESVEKKEDEETVERVIRNVNLRRTLSFIFRELNQVYTTKVHLVEVRVAFTNGQPGTWREASLSGLRGLLSTVLKPGKVDGVARQILNSVGVVFDNDDKPVNVLETFTMKDNGATLEGPKDAKRDGNGNFAAPTTDTFYRYKRGALGQDAKDPEGRPYVPGVVLKEDEVVMRTDSLVVEALLGQADALDEYAMISQKADAEAKELANKRAEIVNQGLEKIADGAKRAAAYAAIADTNGAVRLELEQKK